MIKGSKVVTLLSEKGGVGKSFLARELMASCERSGDDAELVNIDPQYAVARSVGGHAVEVLDTPGHLGNQFDLIVMSSDVIVIPTRPTAANVEPLVRVVTLVRERTDVPIAIVVNGWNRHLACASWMRWFGSWLASVGVDHDAVFVIPQSEAVAASELSGDSVVELARRGYARGLAGLVFDVVSFARDAAGLAPDPYEVGEDGAIAASDATEVARTSMSA